MYDNIIIKMTNHYKYNYLLMYQSKSDGSSAYVAPQIVAVSLHSAIAILNGSVTNEQFNIDPNLTDWDEIS